jgi:hypothetical protein
VDPAGNIRALTTLSPIVPEHLRELQRRLRLVRHVPGLGRPLTALGFIHYAGWLIVDGLPPADGCGGWRSLRWKYLLFDSTFDGETDEYLDAFADVLPARIVRVWRPCFGFEEFVMRGRDAHDLPPFAFREFVMRNRLQILAVHVGYAQKDGDFTVPGIRQAIGMQERITPSEEPRDGVESVLEQMAQTGMMAVGPDPGPSPLRARFDAVYRPWKRAVRGQYGVNPLVIAVPLDGDGAAEDLAQDAAGQDLLAGLAGTGTHFARLAILPRTMMDLGQRDPDDLGTPYLLYTSDHYGTVYEHVQGLWECGAARQIWGRCVGYPKGDGALALHTWLNRHRLPTQYYVSGYPPRPVADIANDVRRRRAVAAAYGDPAARPRGPGPVQLLDRWRRG